MTVDTFDDFAHDTDDVPVDDRLPADPVVVRRNAAFAALVGLAASAVAIAYLWRAVSSGAPLDWALCAVLAGIAAIHLAHLVDARTPLLVADELGVRIRLGNHWRGLPWDAVAAVSVQPRRGLVRDGRLLFSPHSLARALDGLDTRGRRAAVLNQKLYGAALAVPLGLTTRVSVPAGEIARRLDALTDTSVAEVEVPAPPVSAEPPLVEPGVQDEPGPEVGDEPEPESGPQVGDEPPASPQRAARSVSPLRSLRHVLRADGGRGPATPSLGAAALLPETGDDEQVPELPESAQLRRLPEDVLPTPVEETSVRPIATLGDPVDPLVLDDYVTEPAYDPVIGPELAAARTRVGLSVDELAERTRIRPHVIESIEVDDFAPCGGDFYARGHIRTLARYLGRDPVALLAHFDHRYATAPINAKKVFEAELATGMTGSMRRTTGGPNWALLVGAVLALVLVWALVRLFASEPQEELRSPVPALSAAAGLVGGMAEAGSDRGRPGVEGAPARLTQHRPLGTS